MSQDSLKIVFAGTPEFGLPSLDGLIKENHKLLAIYTQPDRPAGRGRNLQQSAVKTWAIKHNLPIYQPEHFKDPKTIADLKALNPDLMVVIAYGLILPKSVLAIPKFGCINVHASILPRWRGASPIQHAILHGDEKTGVTIMQMDVGMDTGDYYAIATINIFADDNAQTLHDKLAQLAVAPLIETINNLTINRQLVAHKQDNAAATYAPKIHKNDALIDWQQPATKILQKIRAFNPWPLAFTTINTMNVQILEAEIIKSSTNFNPGEVVEISKRGIIVGTLDDLLAIKTLKFPGKGVIKITDYLNAHKKIIQVGLVLS